MTMTGKATWRLDVGIPVVFFFNPWTNFSNDYEDVIGITPGSPRVQTWKCGGQISEKNTVIVFGITFSIISAEINGNCSIGVLKDFLQCKYWRNCSEHSLKNSSGKSMNGSLKEI